MRLGGHIEAHKVLSRGAEVEWCRNTALSLRWVASEETEGERVFVALARLYGSPPEM